MLQSPARYRTVLAENVSGLSSLVPERVVARAPRHALAAVGQRLHSAQPVGMREVEIAGGRIDLADGPAVAAGVHEGGSVSLNCDPPGDADAVGISLG